MRDVDDGLARGRHAGCTTASAPGRCSSTTPPRCWRWRRSRRLLLLARGWPAGQAHVEITLEPRGTDTVVTIVEQATSGPGALIPKAIQDPQLHVRNIETLRRLAFVVEGRDAGDDGRRAATTRS